MHRIVTFSLGAAGFILVSTAAFAFEKPPFPRLATNWTAYQDYQNPSVQRDLARGSFALISVWPGWEIGRGLTVEQAIRNVKAINPDTLVFNYTNNNEIEVNRQATWAELHTKIEAMGWYLYASGGCCNIVDSSWPGHHALNNTLFSPADSNGDRWVDWYAKWTVNKYILPNPSLDGLYLDNVFWRPRVNGDYNRDGSTDSSQDPTAGSWFRQGLVRHFTVLKQQAPGKFQVGNIADWGAPEANITDYQGLLNGGLIEGMIGYSFSAETWGGWQVMMAWYRKSMSALAEPKLGVFHQVGDPADYQGFRYGFTSSLMDDGYYAFNSDGLYRDAPAFDEYSAELGYATSSPPTSAWQKGVYRRDFENGIALVNPKGNGPQQVTLEADFNRLSGGQAPAVNNGQTVRTLTLQDRDGIVLLRAQRQSRPAPPVLTVQ